MKRKYFNGPSGVYYCPKQNELYWLEWTGQEIYNMKKGKIVGRKYDFYYLGFKRKDIALIGMDGTICIEKFE